MSEPKWEQFKIDPVFDNPGTKQGKIEGFMHAFIEWRAEESETISRLMHPSAETKGAGSTQRKVRKTRKKRVQ